MDSERCPRCAGALHIVRVKFKVTGATVTYACPTCELTRADVRNAELQPEQKSAGFDLAA